MFKDISLQTVAREFPSFSEEEVQEKSIVIYNKEENKIEKGMLDLPDELIAHIVKFTNPSPFSAINFNFVSKQFANAMENYNWKKIVAAIMPLALEGIDAKMQFIAQAKTSDFFAFLRQGIVCMR